MAIYYVNPPTRCDCHGQPLDKVLYDAATTLGGQWAVLCPKGFVRLGQGLGKGLGQKYEKQPDGKWLKVAG